MKTIQETIIETAESYLGQQEISGNMGFKDPNFQEKMEAVGFKDKYAWCALFTELVWRESYAKLNGLFDAELNELFSASAVKTFHNFRRAGWEVDQIPEAGSVVIWQYYKDGKPHWTGHAGIVIFPGLDHFSTVEGNTNSTGEREGIEVSEKVRDLDFASKQKGLVLLGFIRPKQI